MPFKTKIRPCPLITTAIPPSLCQHAEGEPEQFVQAAIKAGLTEYGISDHAPAKPEPFDDWITLSDWDFDNPAWLEKWAKTDANDAWDRYWKTYANMAESGLFDILGHPDLIKKFGYKPAGDLRRFYEPVVDAIAATGCAIELNTAGWHKPCKKAYPEIDFLDLAFSAGIPLVISSDAHHPSEVARDFDQAIELAKQAGYTNTLLFDQYQRSFEAL